MLPVFPAHNTTNDGLCNAEFSMQGTLGDSCGVQASYLNHLRFGKLGTSILSSSVRATLSDAVHAVIHLRPQKQMIWTKAQRVVAFVEHAPVVGNLAVCPSVCNAVDSLNFPVDPCDSIPETCSTSWPLQAFSPIWVCIQQCSYQLIACWLHSGLVGADFAAEQPSV